MRGYARDIGMTRQREIQWLASPGWRAQTGTGEGKGMQTITLGRSELEVSRIAFGTWQLGGEWGSVDADEA